MKTAILYCFFILLFSHLACSKKVADVRPDDIPTGLDGVSFIAKDIDGNLKFVEFSDTALDNGDSAIAYIEMGIDFDWELLVLYRLDNWQASYFLLRSETISGELRWNGNRVVGETITEDGARHTIDRDLSEFSIHAWYLQSALMGFPFDTPQGRLEFDLITPELQSYGYYAENAGTEGVATTERWFDCYKLEVDGRGAIGLFAPDIRLYYRRTEPTIPIQYWTENAGFVFEWFSDSI